MATSNGRCDLRLDDHRREAFRKLYGELLLHADRSLGIAKRAYRSGDQLLECEPSAQLIALRDRLWNTPRLLDGFVRTVDGPLTPWERNTIASWRSATVVGRFWLTSAQDDGYLFLSAASSERAYAVVSPSRYLLEDLVPRPWPTAVETVLLPFEGRIIHDGFVECVDVEPSDQERTRIAATIGQVNVLTRLAPFEPPVDMARIDSSHNLSPSRPHMLTQAERRIVGEAVPERRSGLALKRKDKSPVQLTEDERRRVLAQIEATPTASFARRQMLARLADKLRAVE